MGGNPTAEQFESLAKVFSRYCVHFDSAWRDSWVFDGQRLPSEREVAELVGCAVDISTEAFELCFDDQAGCAFEWLNGRPEFALAKQTVGFRPLSEALGEGGYSGRFERIIRRCAEQQVNDMSTALRLAGASGRYLKYVSGVSSAAANFMSGRTARAALDGSATFDRMLELVAEFEQLLEADWLPGVPRHRLSASLGRLAGTVEKCRPPSPISKRNDADLPARLMASELIGIHQGMFSATHKRAVFHLMGLPIIDRPIEMRTIERLAKARKERRRSS